MTKIGLMQINEMDGYLNFEYRKSSFPEYLYNNTWIPTIALYSDYI